MVEPLVLAERAPSRLRLAHVFEAIKGQALVRLERVVGTRGRLFRIPIL